MICGGSPCQDFSVAGKQEGSRWRCNRCHKSWNPLTVHFDKRDFCPFCGTKNLDKTRSSLLVEWLRIIRANKPKWAIYENVKALTSKKFKETFQMFLDELSEYGYNTYWQVLNAKDFGIPQNRERVYVIIVRKDLDNGKFVFPEPFESDITLKDVLEDQVDESYYVNTPRAQKLIEDLIASGKLTKQTSNTVRGGQRQCRKSPSVGCDSDKELTMLGGVSDKRYGKQYRLGDRVYDSGGVAATVCANPVGNTGGYSCLYCVDNDDAPPSQRITGLFANKCGEFKGESEIANTLLARDYKGFGNQAMNGVIDER